MRDTRPARIFRTLLLLTAAFLLGIAPSLADDLPTFSITVASVPGGPGKPPYNGDPTKAVFLVHAKYTKHYPAIYHSEVSYEIQRISLVASAVFVDPRTGQIDTLVQYTNQDPKKWIYRNVNTHMPPLPMISDGVTYVPNQIIDPDTAVAINLPPGLYSLWGCAYVVKYRWDSVHNVVVAENQANMYAYNDITVGGFHANSTSPVVIKGGVQIAMAKKNPRGIVKKQRVKPAGSLTPYSFTSAQDAPAAGTDGYNYVQSAQFATDIAAAEAALVGQTIPPCPLPFQ